MRKFKFLTLFIAMFGLIACQKGIEQQIYTAVVEGRTTDVPALTGGKIVRLYVDRGDSVDVGTLLAQIDTTELHLQKIRLKAMLKELGLQAEIARTNLNREKSNLEYVEEKFRRVKELYEQNSVPRQQLDDVTNLLNQARAAHQAAAQQVASLESRMEQARAELQLVLKKIHDATITAPTRGIISDKFFEEGEAVPAFSPVVELIDLQEVWAKIYISEKKLPQVKPGQKATVHVDGLEQSLSGKVSWISPRAEFTPKTILTPETRASLVYAVKVVIPNPQGILKHGMPVEITLE